MYEEELSIAQATGLEVILMGDFNIDVTVHSNKKMATSNRLIRFIPNDKGTNSSNRDHLYNY